MISYNNNNNIFKYLKIVESEFGIRLREISRPTEKKINRKRNKVFILFIYLFFCTQKVFSSLNFKIAAL